MRAEGYAVESVREVLRELGCQVAGRIYPGWRRGAIAARIVSDAPLHSRDASHLRIRANPPRCPDRAATRMGAAENRGASIIFRFENSPPRCGSEVLAVGNCPMSLA
jgi:hypothetical protein